jgi:hypothetical protein
LCHRPLAAWLAVARALPRDPGQGTRRALPEKRSEPRPEKFSNLALDDALNLRFKAAGRTGPAATPVAKPFRRGVCGKSARTAS